MIIINGTKAEPFPIDFDKGNQPTVHENFKNPSFDTENCQFTTNPTVSWKERFIKQIKLMMKDASFGIIFSIVLLATEKLITENTPINEKLLEKEIIFAPLVAVCILVAAKKLNVTNSALLGSITGITVGVLGSLPQRIANNATKDNLATKEALVIVAGGMLGTVIGGLYRA